MKGYDDVADQFTGEVRLCSRMCDTCIFRPGDLMRMRPGRVAGMVNDAREAEGHIPCHSTLGTGRAAVCRGYADGPDMGRSLALRIGRALGTIKEVDPPEKEPKG